MLVIGRLASNDARTEADGIAQRSRVVLDRVLPSDHTYHALHRYAHGVSRAGLGDPADALRLMQESLDVLRRTGNDSPAQCYVLSQMIDSAVAAGDPARATILRDDLAATVLHTPAGSVPHTWTARALGPEHADLTQRIRDAERRSRQDGALTADLLEVVAMAEERFGAGERAAVVAGRLIGVVQVQGYAPAEVALPLLQFCVDRCKPGTESHGPTRLTGDHSHAIRSSVGGR